MRHRLLTGVSCLATVCIAVGVLAASSSEKPPGLAHELLVAGGAPVKAHSHACEPDLAVHFPPEDDPQSFVCGLFVQVNGGVWPEDGCPQIARIHWSWGDGDEYDSWFPAQHVYPSAGTYTVVVIAFDMDGNSSEVSGEVTVTSEPVAKVPESERNALIKLHNTTAGTGWTNTGQWLGPWGTECEWFGVTCTSSCARVSTLDLYNNNLSGRIPVELGDLPSLVRFTAFNNLLTGEIPEELGDLTDLMNLDLGGNLLGGEIPAEIGNLTSLFALHLNDNQLSGSLPSELGNLTSLADNGGLNLCGNALYTENTALRDFLNTKQSGGDWEACQEYATTGGTEVTVTPAGATVERQTASATDRNGNRVVVWRQSAGAVKRLDGNLALAANGAGIFARYYDAHDNPVGDLIEVAAETTDATSSPTVSFDGSGGFVVGWQEDGDAAGSLRARRYSADLQAQTGAIAIADGAAAPAVAASHSGHFVMTWRAGGGIFARLFAADGTAKGSSFRVDDGTASDVSAPQVAADASGRFVVVWQQTGWLGAKGWQEGNTIVGRFYDPAGAPQTDPVAVDDGGGSGAEDPGVGSDALGNVTIVWADRRDDGDGQDVYGRRFTMSGQAACSPYRVNTATGGDQRAPAVGVSAPGDVAVAWESSPSVKDGEGNTIVGHFYTPQNEPVGPDFTVAGTEDALAPAAPAVSASSDDQVTVSYTRVTESGADGEGVFFTTFDIVAQAGSCQQAATVHCLNSDRFQVEVSWTDFAGRTGSGQAVTLTDDTGYFWFFRDSNVELIIKVLDGTALNGYYWVFFGALSNVEYTIRVSDTFTGTAATYFNPMGNFACYADTAALPQWGKAAEAAERHVVVPAHSGGRDPDGILYDGLMQLEAGRRRMATAGVCQPAADTLCLNNDRFAVTVDWQTTDDRSGAGMAVPLTGDTGYFWFFRDSNVELVVKVLDGRTLNGHFWVFYGALSDVQYTITVEDTETGETRAYDNPQGQMASVGDTTAF